MQAIRLAVRTLVEMSMRSGDIDNRRSDARSMNYGAKAHRELQSMMGEGYQSEVSLKLRLTIAGTPVILHGRADGIITEADGSVTVDEIKTTSMPLERLISQSEAHMAQAKCYAYMLFENGGVNSGEITIQLTYFQIESGEIQRQSAAFTREEISAFFFGLTAKYAVFLNTAKDWEPLRSASVKQARFPFPSYREGQRSFAIAVYSAIDKGKRLYAQAPTGIGKTISALFPSIKAIGEGKVKKLFYLTAKTVTRTVAEDAVRLMAKNGLRLRSITLRAKEKLCLNAEVDCNPDSCKYAKGHYDRVNDAIFALIKENDAVTADMVTEYAMKHTVCPFELMLDASSWADLIICDYNHVFDPVAYLKRYFEDAGEDYVFLIDEAHNLYERARDMYSATLRKSDFSKVRSGLKGKGNAAIKKAITNLNRHLTKLLDEGERERADKTAGEELVSLVREFVGEAALWLESAITHPLRKDMTALYFDALFFTDIAAIFDDTYARIIRAYGNDVAVTLFCIDPSGIISKRLELAKSAALFSATLSPLCYYRDILGGGEDSGILSLPSPFEHERLKLIAHTGISTKYPDRAQSIAPIASAIGRAISQKRGNYIVYFPSYAYMSDVYAKFSEEYKDIATLVQQRDMDETARKAFLDRFSGDNEQTLVGFCVLGGMFSEGVDLSGDRLIGAVIVGVGLPKLSLRQDLIRDYFNHKNGAGYDYAYVYPGMNKVLQAMGRVIRTHTDSGMALLIDSRFGTAKYRELFPPHYSHIKYVRDEKELEPALAEE